ncbi:MAG: DNA polymerase III subunit delta [Armatimonadetes bacterium]|nr:DNA polymerase III subunit delta [Armatimonadota bacterium]
MPHFRLMLPYPAFKKEKALDKGSPRRVYGTLGDAYLQNRVVAALLDWSLDADARDFNLDFVDGEGGKISEVLALASNLPFLSERRAVVVKRAEKMEGLGKSEGADDKKAKKGASAAQKLSEGLKNLPPTTVLILERTPETPEPGDKPTGRCLSAPLDKVIEDVGLIVDCTIDPKNSGLATALVESGAREAGIPLERGAAAHLVERCGHDIARLLSELEKCALSAGLGASVSTQIIDEMTRRAAHESVFDLIDAIGQRRGAHAVALGRELLESGEPPELMLSLLVRHLRQLLQARTFLDAGLPLDATLARRLPPALALQLPKDGRDNLANALQSQSWMARRLGAQSRQFSVSQLQIALENALEADLMLKGIEGDGGFDTKKAPAATIELLIAKLCAG